MKKTVVKIMSILPLLSQMPAQLKKEIQRAS